MKASRSNPLLALALLAIAGVHGAAVSQPRVVSLTPPDGARFLVGQKFDLRVEGKGTGPFSATLAIDGIPQVFTSGMQHTMYTDRITAFGYGGFNLRGYSSEKPGPHTLSATFTDSTGTATLEAHFQILDVKGKSERAKNIIIMLGDGMGMAHRTAARIVRYGVSAGTPKGFLAMDRFPGTGFTTTSSLNSLVTDSSPGMACFTTGNHANNNEEGVFPAHVKSPFHAPRVEYMSEYLHRTTGASLGLVTTADVEDATPAANAVHTRDRTAGTGICDQYLDESDAARTRKYGTGLAVLMGGGRRWFIPRGRFGSSREASTDYDEMPEDVIKAWNLPPSAAGTLDPDRDLLGDFKNAGFEYVETAGTGPNSLRAVGTPDKLLGLFALGNMNAAMDKIAKRREPSRQGVVDDYRDPDQPMLDEMTEVALRVLNRNSRGFVLLVEGAHIDKQSHLMDGDRAVAEVLEFDRAVAVARRFADQVGETVVLVLADHECAGFSVIGTLRGGIQNLETLPADSGRIGPGETPERQKAVGINSKADFPKYEILADGYPETFDIDGKLLFGFGANSDRYESWRQKERPVIDALLPEDLKEELRAKGYVDEPEERGDDAEGFFIRGQVLEEKNRTAVHTATDVPIFSYSGTSKAYQLFYGMQENTDIFFQLMRAVSGGYSR
jgi:alkaline phosphatase